MRKVRVRALLIVAGVVLFAALAVVAAVLVDPAPEELRSVDQSPAFVRVGRVGWDGTQVADLTVTYEPPLVGRSPGGLGTITSLAPAGATLTVGDEIMKVGGRTLRLFVAPEPLWRPLSRGDEGDDVRALASYLSSSGYLADPSEVVSMDGSVITAVRAYRADHGHATGSTFEPQMVVWHQNEQISVASWVVGVGQSLPSEGEPIFYLPPAPVGAAIEPSVNVQEAFREQPDGWVFDWRGVSLSVGADRTVERLALAQLVEDLEPPEPGNRAVTVSGVLRLEEPLRFSTVPTSALVVDAGGGTCIWTRSGVDTAIPVQVEVAGGVPPAVRVSLQEADTMVLLDPALLVDKEATCDSSQLISVSDSNSEE